MIDWEKPLENDYGEVSNNGDNMWVQTDYARYSVNRDGTPKHPDLPKSFTVRNKQTVVDEALSKLNKRARPQQALGRVDYVISPHAAVHILKEANLLKDDE